MTIHTILSLISVVVLTICLALMLKMIYGLRAEIREIWTALSNLSTMLHDNDEALRSIKSHLAVHPRPSPSGGEASGQERG